MSGVGTIIQGIQANALAKEQARSVKAQGREAEKISRREGKALKGVQRTLTAASGIAREGTVLDVLAQTAEDVELNALRAKFGFELKEQGLLIAGKQALISGIGKGVTSIIGQVASFGAIGNAGGSSTPGPSPLSIGEGTRLPAQRFETRV